MWGGSRSVHDRPPGTATSLVRWYQTPALAKHLHSKVLTVLDTVIHWWYWGDKWLGKGILPFPYGFPYFLFKRSSVGPSGCTGWEGWGALVRTGEA